MAKQILAKLRALPFWPTLKKKISFLVSDSCGAQLHANKLIIEGLKAEEGISAVEIVCQMHATAWLGNCLFSIIFHDFIIRTIHLQGLERKETRQENPFQPRSE